ncbi:unnamed protein product [Orchesella dallaii]|uniref:Uncharacterized protein n=1 Tax=Orchesella dallaii TaxID=48710 RepID=A0ABP1R652_9HEXA
MLRFLSNYLFQNENAEPNEDPTATINQNPLNDKDKANTSSQSQNHEEPDDLQGPTPKAMEEGDDDDNDEDQDEVDDWVLIGDGDKKNEERVANGHASKLTVGEVELVAPNDEEENTEGCEEEEEGAKEEGEGGLLWENKLIEHPSMSVYIDLATSLTNGATSCMSLSSIAPATSPGESVIVLEHDDGDDDDDDDDDMDILETIEMIQLPQLASVPKKSQAAPIPPPQPMIQNGRRKKGHYPCSSSNSGNMPRRHGIRNSGPRQAFQMISSSSTTTGDLNEEERNRPIINNNNSSNNSTQNQSNKKKRANNAANSSSSSATDTPITTPCGIAIVGTPPGGPTSALGHHSSNMLNKNLKLLDLFPARGSYSRKAEAQKMFSTPRGHHLQEGRRRSDLQNYMRHSHANNDRRSAQQRRVQKVGGGEGRK